MTGLSFTSVLAVAAIALAAPLLVLLAPRLLVFPPAALTLLAREQPEAGDQRERR